MVESRPRLVLIGPPASGKTKVGRRVAALLDEPFVDTDQVIVAEHGPIPDLFAQDGEVGFRKIEREVVARSLRQPGVVSLGGGAITQEATRQDLRDLLVVGLEITPEAVAPRLDNDKRPLLRNGLADWEALVSSRRSLYDEVTTWQVDVSHRPTEEIALEIASWVTHQQVKS